MSLLWPDSERAKQERLPGVIREWIRVVEQLRGLAQRQLDAVENSSEAGVVRSILAEKDEVYRAAAGAAAEFVALEAAIPPIDPALHGALPDPLLLESERAHLLDLLKEVDDLEARSQALLKRRQCDVLAELRAIHQKRSALCAYAASGPMSPRFLDRKR